MGDSNFLEMVNSAPLSVKSISPLVVFQIFSSRVWLKCHPWEVPNAGFGGQVLLRGWQSVKVWATTEVMVATNRANDKRNDIVKTLERN